MDRTRLQVLAPAFFLGVLSPVAAVADSAEVSDPATWIRKKESIESELTRLPEFHFSSQQHGRLGFYGVVTDEMYIVVDLGRRAVPDEVVLFPARISPEESAESAGFPQGIEVEMSDLEDFSEVNHVGIWREPAQKEEAGISFLRFPGDGVGGRYLRVRISGGRQRKSGGGRFFSLGELVVLEDGVNVALDKEVTTSRSIENSPRWQRANLTDGYLWCLPFFGAATSPTNGFHSGIETSATSERKWVEVDLGAVWEIDEVRLIPAHPQDFADTAGFGFPPRFELRAMGDLGEDTILYRVDERPFPNPGAAAVMFPAAGVKARRVRFESDDLWFRTEDFLIALSEMQIWGDGRNLSLGRPVTASDAVETGAWRTAALTDGFSSRHELLTWTEWLDGLSRREMLEKRREAIIAGLDRRSAGKLRRLLIGSGVLTVIVAMTAGVVVLRQRRQAALAQHNLRQRIAADLHDELGASLSHLALQGELAASELDDKADESARERLLRLSDSARTALDDMRDVIWLLGEGPGSWPEFANRLETIAERLLDGIDHEFSTAGDPPPGRPPIEWAREVVLFLKEAIANARRHASATRIAVILPWGDRFELLVEDDGSGFDPETASRSRRRSGMGLRNLAERAAKLGGTARISSDSQRGTTVRLSLPLPANRP